MDARSHDGKIALVVDLDGTLIASDLLWESLFLLLRTNPFYLLLALYWLTGGPARLKQEIARRVDIDPASLPYRQEVLDRMQVARAAGRRVVLATGSARKFAEAIAAHLGVFDEVHAAEQPPNFTARNKCRSLIAAYGDGGFDYMGNSRADLCLFEAARRAIVVAPDASAARWHARHGGDLIGGPRIDLGTLMRMLRVHQWLKNTLIAVPMVLAHDYLDAGMLLASLLAFVSFSAAASAIYIVNDFFDLALDRAHPSKSRRPFASGRLSVPFGIGASLLLLVVSAAAAWPLPAEFALVLAAYLIATTAYSLSIKRMLLIDVLTLAGLYTMRILGGAAATGIGVSFWLLAFSVFFFLSLALVKRYVELRSTTLDIGQRIAGRGYRREDQEIVGQAGMAAAFSAVLVLALYIDSNAVRQQYAHPYMIWPLAPIVLYLTMRVWVLARRDELHEDPVVFIIRDWRSQVVAGLGALLLAVAVVLP